MILMASHRGTSPGPFSRRKWARQKVEDGRQKLARASGMGRIEYLVTWRIVLKSTTAVKALHSFERMPLS